MVVWCVKLFQGRPTSLFSSISNTRNTNNSSTSSIVLESRECFDERSTEAHDYVTRDEMRL
jgi:hypothetical protein